MMISRWVITVLSLNLAVFQARADVNLKECSYDVHGAHVSDIREDHYYQNPFEMTRIDDRNYKGSLELNDGYTLHLNVQISGGKIRMTSEVRDSDHVSIRLAGAAALPASGSQGYKLAKSTPTVVDSEEGSKTVFENIGIRCVVTPTFGQKLRELVTRAAKPIAPSPRRASRQAGVS